VRGLSFGLPRGRLMGLLGRQRRLFWLAVDATGSRLLGYLLAMPGTVLHESAHFTRDACLLLAVPAIASGLSLLVLDTFARFRR
jgi:hypothetical protein